MSDQQADPQPGPTGADEGSDAPTPPSRGAGRRLGQMIGTQTNRSTLAMVVVGGLLLTFVSAFLTMSNDQAQRHERFDDAALDASRSVQAVANDYVDLLVGARGLFATGEVPDRETFDQWVASQDLGDRLPGALTVGYAPRVPADEVEDLEADVQDEGYPDFAVRPESDQTEVFPVVYLEPMAGAESIFGFDHAADERGRAAVELAGATGDAAFGPPVGVITADGSQRRAYNVYLATYDSGSVPESEDRRRVQFGGVTFVLTDSQAAFAGLAGEDAEVLLEVYDLGAVGGPPGVEPNESNLLFDSDDDQAAISGSSGLDQRIELTVAGRRWLVFVQPGPGFSAPSASFPWLVVLAGLAITILLAALIVSFAQTRTQAMALADEMTASLRQREQELRRANDDIVRSNKELERYASIAAHDLQEPLRSLLAYASVLERRYGETLDPDVLDQVQRMARAAERMRSLVVDLLTYAKTESEQRKLERVDLNEAIRIAIDDLSVLIHETGATIRASKLPTVPGNRRELIGVFSNLLSNALKYRSDARPEVAVVAHERGDEWVIGVRDNGIGIDPAYHERIFELFRRLEKRSTDAGTGLGLAICARTIAQHGGRIWVESEEGVGSTFWFTLPAHTPDWTSGGGTW